MKKILLALILSFSFTAKAGLMDSRYFEPVAGCLVGGGIGYLSSDSQDAMKNAAIYCGIAAVVAGVVGYHYDSKYGKEFLPRENFLDNQERRYDMLEKQKNSKSEHRFFKRQREVLPAKILPNGQGIGPRIKERLILEDDNIDLGN